MEADSTTIDSKISKTKAFPFPVQAENLKLYLDITSYDGQGSQYIQLVHKLQNCGLLAKTLACRKGDPDCRMVCKTARVVDRVQWVCESCGQRLPIRQGSFFMRLQCSLLQGLQMMLAWAEDADIEQAASFFDIKTKVATQIYDKLDQLAIEEQGETRLGGAGAVVLTEMYPDCLNRLSPDTTDQPHAHRILMLADTKHIPTRYWLHVLKQDPRKPSSEGDAMENKFVTKQIKEVISKVVRPESLLVAGNYAPPLDGAVALHGLLQHCDTDMRQFLCTRIWRQALALCAASRGAGAPAAQRYLDAALGRVRHAGRLYARALELVAGAHATT